MIDDPDDLRRAAALGDGLGPLIEAARRETDRRLSACPEAAGADAVHAMMASPTVEQVNSLTLGVIAVREFEADEPAYCDLLCEAAFRFKALAAGPG